MVEKPAERKIRGRQEQTKILRKITSLGGGSNPQRQPSGAAPLAGETPEQLRSRQYHSLDCLPLPLLGIDLDKRIYQCNPAAAALLGIRAENALGQTLQQLLPEFPRLDESLDLVTATQCSKHLGRFPWARTEPSRLFELGLYPSGEFLSPGVLLRIDDVTEQAQREEFILQQEKMGSISNLATGVANEINQPLVSILQNLQVMRNRLHPNLPKNIELAHDCGFDIDHLDHYIEARGIHAILNAAIEAGKNAADIVHNMLNFSQKDDSGFQYQTLSSLLDKAVELAAGNHYLLNDLDFRKIEIVRHYDQDLPACYCSPGQLQQVFLHLLNSGARALSKRLRFWEKNSATLPSAEKPRLVLGLKKRGDCLRCEIEDNGCGMDDELRRRVFEPFYTTPKPGTGTGLDMSICYFIISNNHCGRMSVESRSDIGSRFILELPLQTPRKALPTGS
jgi:signal transduction histidine kinase